MFLPPEISQKMEAIEQKLDASLRLMSAKQFIGVSEFADITGLGISTICTLCQKGELAAVQIHKGCEWKIYYTEVDRIIKTALENRYSTKEPSTKLLNLVAEHIETVRKEKQAQAKPSATAEKRPAKRKDLTFKTA